MEVSAVAQEQDLAQVREATRRKELNAHRGRLAWLAIGSSFLIFCFLCVGVVFGVSYYTANAPETHGASLELSHGTSLEINRAGTTSYLVSRIVSSCRDRSVSQDPNCKETLAEGDTIKTGSDTDAWVTLFDGSTITLNYDTTIRLQRLRSSRFFNQFKDIVIQLERGSIRVATADPISYGNNPVQVLTEPHTWVQVQENSVTDVAMLQTMAGCGSLAMPCTQAIARVGKTHIAVSGAQQNFDIVPQQNYSEMARIGADGKMRGPDQAEEELISNGDFVVAAPQDSDVEFASGWRLGGRFSPAPGAIERTSESLDQETVRLAARFVRPVEGQVLATPATQDVDRTRIYQELGRQASFYSSMSLTFRIKLVEQSEVGVGADGQIYPLTVRLSYLDAEGAPLTWTRKFYYTSSVIAKAPDAIQVVRGGWLQQDFPLLDTTGPISAINSIEFEAAGYIYDVWVTNIELIGR